MTKKLPKIINIFIMIFLFSLFIIYPLYFRHDYYDMVYAKYDLFKIIYRVFIPGMSILSILYLIKNKKNIKLSVLSSKITKTDMFVLAYLITCLLSYAFSFHKDTSFFGTSGWYMGLVTQIVMILFYFFLSIWFSDNKHIWWIITASSSIVFILGILQRFNIDILSMQEGFSNYGKLENHLKNLYISTLGQSTWHSSYLCIILSIAMACFFLKNKYNTTTLKQKTWSLLWGLFLSICFCALVIQNSDSGFVALLGMFLVLFFVSFNSNEYFKRFLEIIIICLASWKFIGILQVIFKDNAFDIGGISTFCTQNIIPFILLIFMIILYSIFCFLIKNNKFDIKKFIIFRNIIFILIPISIIALVVVMYLVTTGKINNTLNISYLNFNNSWGSDRGFIWKFSMSMFNDYSIGKKLFGCGPDAFAFEAYNYNPILLQSYLVEPEYIGEKLTVLACAHNEWLNHLINFGIVGAISYIGIFLSAFVIFIKNYKKHPLILGGAIAIIAYMMHNFFCYQQILSTPIIFVIIGIGIAIIRNIKRKEENRSIDENV